MNNAKSTTNYLESLDLHISPELSILESTTEVDLTAPAFVDAGSIVTFVSGVDEETKQDVLNSTLFAQLAANKKYDRENETLQWYQFYVEVLENVGWNIVLSSFTKYNSAEKTLQLDKAALQIIAAVATGGQLTILTKTLEVLQNQDEGSDAITLFDGNSAMGASGNFQIGAGGSDNDGNATLSMGMFYFKSVEKKKKILFVGWRSKTINFYTSASTVVLNKEIYATVRDTIGQKLAEVTKKYVQGIEI